MNSAAQQIDLYSYVERSISPMRVDEGRAERVTRTIAPRKRRASKKKVQVLPPEALEYLEAQQKFDEFHNGVAKGIYSADSWRGDGLWLRLQNAEKRVRMVNEGLNPYKKQQ